MDFFSTNLFDLAIYLCLFVAVVMGFMTGLLRSLAAIFGYVFGMAVAVAAAPKLTPMLTTYLKMPTPQTWIVFVALFVAAGAAIRIGSGVLAACSQQRVRSRPRMGCRRAEVVS